MAIRINPQSGLMEMVKDREASSAALGERLRPKTPIEGLQERGPVSLEAQKPTTLFQEQPSTPPPVVKFDIPDIQKGRELSDSQIAQREKFRSIIEESDSRIFADEAVENRERERVIPFSEIREDVLDFEDYTNDGMGESIKRSDRFTTMFHSKLESGATVAGAYLTEAQSVPIIMGATPEEAGTMSGQEINPNSVKGILFDPKGFNAGQVMDEGFKMQVHPLFARIMGLATEKFILQNQYNVPAKQDTEAEGGLEDFSEKALSEVERVTTEEGVLRRGIGNQQLGREIFRAWKREQNAMQGRPTDEYTEAGVTADQFETLGVTAKEMYHAANPELYSSDRGSLDDRNVQFKLTPLGATALAAAEASSPEVFSGYEIPPSTIPRRRQRVTEAGEGESKKYRKAKTTSVIEQKIREVEEARDNMNSVAHGVDPLRRKIYVQLAMEVLTGLKNSTRPPEIGDLLKIGPAKMIAFRGELDKKLLDDPNTDYKPEFEMEKQITKFIETLNTIAKYSNQANYLDPAVQELQTRMHFTQTRFNPQLIPWIRFVTGGLNPPTVNPNAVNSDETLMFKELMAKHFIPGADKLLPENRVAAFDAEWNSPNHGKFASYIQDGKSISESLLDSDQDQKSLESMKKIGMTSKGISIPPELASIPRLNISGNLKKKAIGEELEGLQLIEAAHELFKFEQAKKSNTSFQSNIGIEFDGKTHGPASNLMQLGSMKAAFRAGVLRKAGATKNLDSIPVADLYQGAETEPDLQAGDIRDAMNYFMEENGQIYAQNFSRNTDIASSMNKILKLALKDRDNFLKKPPMTLAYGQLLKNLRKAIIDTIFIGPSSVKIRQIINSKQVGAVVDKKIAATKGMVIPTREDIVADYLHNILADAIDAELDPGVVQVGQLLRANNVVAMLSDEVMKVKNAIGVDNYIGARSTMMRDDIHGNTGVMFGKDSPVKRAGAVPLYESQPSGSAVRKGKPGGWGRGRIIPAVIQGIDGAWMNRMFTGASWAKMNRQYMLPIMDAVKTDLRGARKARELANDNWWNVIEEYSYVNSLMEDWTPGAIQRFRTKLRNIGDTKVDINMDNEYRGFYWLLNDTETNLFSEENLVTTLYDTMDHPPRERGEPVKSYEWKKRVRAEGLAANLLPKANSMKGKQVKELSGNNLLRLFDNILGVEGVGAEPVQDPKTNKWKHQKIKPKNTGLNVLSRNYKTIEDVGKAKKKLMEAAKDFRKLQIDM
jgi:hypothetical protein